MPATVGFDSDILASTSKFPDETEIKKQMVFHTYNTSKCLPSANISVVCVSVMFPECATHV